jgi:epoxyqueuosine reductase QueG
MSIKQTLIDIAGRVGAWQTGFAPVSRWQTQPIAAWNTSPRPSAILAEAKTVIVLGAPVWLPLIEASPSVLGREQIFVTDKLLEEAAYQLVIRIAEHGGKVVSVPKYVKNQTAGEQIFSNELAGYYAGLGTLGWNHRLLTKEWGSRLQLKSVITDLELEGDEVITESLCTNCRNCERVCPVNALKINQKDNSFAEYDAEKCARQCAELEEGFVDPCGFCKKVCPAGGDRKLFKSEDTEIYFKEDSVLAKNPDTPQYASWVHIRKYGIPGNQEYAGLA